MPDPGGEGRGGAERSLEAFTDPVGEPVGRAQTPEGRNAYRGDADQIFALAASGRSIRLFTAPGGRDDSSAAAHEGAVIPLDLAVDR